MKIVEVGCLRKTPSDRLKSRLGLFENSFPYAPLVGMSLAVGEHAKCGLADRRGRAALNFKETHLSTGIVAVCADIVADNVIEGHARVDRKSTRLNSSHLG